MKKLSALQGLLQHKFALLIAAGAVTALFVVFAAIHTTGTGRFLANNTALKPNTASANLEYDDGCSNAFWQWWTSGSDEDYFVAEFMCSGGGGGGGIDSGGGGGGGCYWGDCNDEGGWEGGDDCFWGGCGNDYYPGANEGSDYNPGGGPPMGTCWPGYNMDAFGDCYPNGGVDDACHNPVGIDFENCDPSVPYDPTPTLCSDPYYRAMNINQCGVANIPGGSPAGTGDCIDYDEFGFPCEHDVPQSSNGLCSDEFYAESHPYECPQTIIVDEKCNDVNYALSHPVECVVVGVPGNEPDRCDEPDMQNNCPNPRPDGDPIPIDPNNPLAPADEIRRCESEPGFKWNYLAQRCEAYALPDPCTSDLHYAAGHVNECTPNASRCSDPYYATGHPECDLLPPPPANPNPPSDDWRERLRACQNSGGQWNYIYDKCEMPTAPVSDTGSCMNVDFYNSHSACFGRPVGYDCLDNGTLVDCATGGRIDTRPTTPTRSPSGSGDDEGCTDEAGGGCRYRPAGDTTNSESNEGGTSWPSRIGRTIRNIFTGN